MQTWVPAQRHTGTTRGWGIRERREGWAYGDDGSFEPPRPLAAILRDA